MALRLALRRVLPISSPYRMKVKMTNIPKEALEEGEDILDKNFAQKNPMLDPAPGFRYRHESIPSDFWYAIQGKVRQKPVQPGYCCYPVGTQTWHLFNASAIPLGRMAGRIASLLTGKYKPTFDRSRISPESEGDFVVVINGKFPLIHGKKAKLKIYRSHSTYPGGLHERNICRVLEGNNYRQVVEHAVYGMLPRTNVRPFYLERLHVYPDLYHDLTHLPQLLPRAPTSELTDLGLDKVLSEGELVFSTHPNALPPHLKDMKKAENDDAVKGLEGKTVKAYTPQEEKDMRRYRKVLLRYRSWNYKTQRYEL